MRPSAMLCRIAFETRLATTLEQIGIAARPRPLERNDALEPAQVIATSSGRE